MERLQEILQMVKWNETRTISLDSAKLLVSEIERLQNKETEFWVPQLERLQAENGHYVSLLQDNTDEFLKLQQKEERLENALKFYADKSNHNWEFEGEVTASKVMVDNGRAARKALETEGKE
jgi:hypothetical protein